MSGVRVPAPPPFSARLRRVEPALRRAFRGPCALPPGSIVLIAASGGADSTALLAGMRRIAPELEIEIRAAHLHHGLRGADADADLAAVRALCASLGVPLIAGRTDAADRMSEHGLSGQQGLRLLRRAFLRRAAGRAGAAAIATAHTADDQLETLLMRLVRGTGLEGLGGMRERRGRWLKPLLEVTRSDIEADLVRAGISWREDASNRDPRYFRNRIRLEVIPALAAAGPGRPAGAFRAKLARRVAGSMREVRETAEALRLWTMRARQLPDRQFALASSELAPYPIAVRRIALAEIWRALPGCRSGLTGRHLEALVRLAASGNPGASVSLPGGWVARHERGWLRFHPPSIPQGMEAT